MNRSKLLYSTIGLRWEELHREYKSNHSRPECFCSSYPAFDPDFAAALDRYQLDGSSVLEVGSGYGEQSVAIAREAKLNVCSLEVSKTAIDIAKLYASDQGISIDFVNDNILTVNLDKSFAAVFDRGCFTIIPHNMRAQYAKNVFRHTEPNGYLFLKANRTIRESAVVGFFKPFFKLMECTDTVYQSTDDRELLAKFFVFKRVEAL